MSPCGTDKCNVQTILTLQYSDGEGRAAGRGRSAGSGAREISRTALISNKSFSKQLLRPELPDHAVYKMFVLFYFMQVGRQLVLEGPRRKQQLACLGCRKVENIVSVYCDSLRHLLVELVNVLHGMGAGRVGLTSAVAALQGHTGLNYRAAILPTYTTSSTSHPPEWLLTSAG